MAVQLNSTLTLKMHWIIYDLKAYELKSFFFSGNSVTVS